MKTMLIWFGILSASLLIQEKTNTQNTPPNTTLTQESENQKTKVKTPQVEDITELVRKNNDPTQFAGPPIKFNKGHVNPRQLDANAIKLNENGFEIQLPSKAPIPTITFYDGRIYCSGGFHSKEFYCFDAVTGKIVWGINLDDDGPTSAVCEDDICVFSTESCTIFAVDALTGSHRWSWWLGDPLMSTPMIANGKVFASYPASGRFEGDGTAGGGGGQGILNQQPSFNAPQQQGKQQAQLKQTEAGKQNRKGDDLRMDDRKPPQGQSHVLACFDLKTGKIIWQRWIDSDVMSAPVADGNDLYATSFAGTVYRFEQETGKVLSAVKSRATSAPTIVNGKVNFARRTDENGETARESIGWFDENMKQAETEFNEQNADYLAKGVQQQSKLKGESSKLDAGNGFGGGAPQQANPAPALENIGQNNVSSLQGFQGSRGLYFAGNSYCCPGDKIICNDQTGKELWAIKLEGDMKKLGGMLAAPPIHAGGYILVSTLAGEVLQIDPDQGKTVATYKIGQPLRFPPIVNEGRIYVGTQQGKVFAINTNNPDLTGWTTWGGNSKHNKTK